MGVIETLLEQYGYAALVVIMLLDSSGVPWPTEATLVLTGAAAQAGHLNLWVAGASSLGGAALGCTFSYLIGRRLGDRVTRRIAAFFHLTPERMNEVDAWFAMHGHRTVFFARLFPFVRCFAGFPAGAMGMPFGTYALYSLGGYLLYVALALGLGFGGLSFARWLGDLEIILWFLIPIGLLFAYLKWGRRRGRSQRNKGL